MCYGIAGPCTKVTMYCKHFLTLARVQGRSVKMLVPLPSNNCFVKRINYFYYCAFFRSGQNNPSHQRASVQVHGLKNSIRLPITELNCHLKHFWLVLWASVAAEALLCDPRIGPGFKPNLLCICAFSTAVYESYRASTHAFKMNVNGSL